MYTAFVKECSACVGEFVHAAAWSTGVQVPPRARDRTRAKTQCSMHRATSAASTPVLAAITRRDSRGSYRASVKPASANATTPINGNGLARSRTASRNSAAWRSSRAARNSIRRSTGRSRLQHHPRVLSSSFHSSLPAVWRNCRSVAANRSSVAAPESRTQRGRDHKICQRREQHCACNEPRRSWPRSRSRNERHPRGNDQHRNTIAPHRTRTKPSVARCNSSAASSRWSNARRRASCAVCTSDRRCQVEARFRVGGMRSSGMEVSQS